MPLPGTFGVPQSSYAGSRFAGMPRAEPEAPDPNKHPDHHIGHHLDHYIDHRLDQAPDPNKYAPRLLVNFGSTGPPLSTYSIVP